jgi:TolB-like protein
MSLSSGTRLGPYEIRGSLGRGGMGEVYRAADPRLGREVAIKILSADAASDPDSIRRFEKEARAVASLSDPHIVPLFDVGEAEGLRYVVTELVDGETLRSLLLSGPLPTQEAARIASEVATGLAAAHEKGLVHRDIKPENIILARNGAARILDFGLVQQIERRPLAEAPEDAPTAGPASTEIGTIAGTVGYMSPEQVRGERPDGRSDIFSLGTVLYEMATGQRAFRADSRIETLNAILKEEPDAGATERAGLPAEMDRILRRCLEKRPENRYHSAADLAHDLRAVAAEGASVPRALRPPARGRLSRPKAAVVAALAVALLGTIAALLLPRLRPGRATRLPRTLAVLPFRGIGQDASLEHFGLGLADSLIGRLASLRDLTVRPTSAIARYETQAVETLEVGRKLGVDAVLEGTFQRVEGTTRVSVQMTDLSRGAILWSERIDLPEGKLFELQDAISRRIVERLRLELDPGEKRALRQSQAIPDGALEKYLGVRARVPGIALADLPAKQEILRSLDEILREQPDFARAIGTRAYARAWMNFFFPAPSGYEGVVADARRAIALDPELAEPHVALASVFWSSSGKWNVVSAVRELKQAIALAPNLEIARLDLMRIYLHYGWIPESQAQLDEAQRVNPSSPEVLQQRAILKSRVGDHRAALSLFGQLPPENRNLFVNQWQINWDRLMVEDPSRVLPDLEALKAKAPANDSIVPALMALARVRAGKKEIGDLERQILAADSQRGHFHHALHFLAEARAQRGDIAGAVGLLARAAETGLSCPVCFEGDAMLSPIRSSPEYAAFREQLALRERTYRAALKDVP